MRYLSPVSRRYHMMLSLATLCLCFCYLNHCFANVNDDRILISTTSTSLSSSIIDHPSSIIHHPSSNLQQTNLSIHTLCQDDKSKSKQIHVSVSGDDKSGDGSSGKPLRSIPSALTLLLMKSDLERTLCVHPGDFDAHESSGGDEGGASGGSAGDGRNALPDIILPDGRCPKLFQSKYSPSAINHPSSTTNHLSSTINHPSSMINLIPAPLRMLSIVAYNISATNPNLKLQSILKFHCCFGTVSIQRISFPWNVDGEMDLRGCHFEFLNSNVIGRGVTLRDLPFDIMIGTTIIDSDRKLSVSIQQSSFIGLENDFTRPALMLAGNITTVFINESLFHGYSIEGSGWDGTQYGGRGDLQKDPMTFSVGSVVSIWSDCVYKQSSLTMSIIKSSFLNNNCTLVSTGTLSQGCAVSVASSCLDVLTVHQSTFTSNSAGTSVVGGAPAIQVITIASPTADTLDYHTSSTVLITSSTFHNNTSPLTGGVSVLQGSSGGALLTSSQYLNITDSSFSENRADEGGALTFSGCYFNSTNTVFLRNKLNPPSHCASTYVYDIVANEKCKKSMLLLGQASAIAGTLVPYPRYGPAIDMSSLCKSSPTFLLFNITFECNTMIGDGVFDGVMRRYDDVSIPPVSLKAAPTASGDRRITPNNISIHAIRVGNDAKCKLFKCGSGTRNSPYGLFDGINVIGCDYCTGGQHSIVSRDDCVECMKGTFTPMFWDKEDCEACNKGWTSASGSTACNECAIGTYQPDIGGTSCRYCDAGHYADTGGMSLCKECPVNTYQPVRGGAACRSCGRDESTNSKTAAILCTPNTESMPMWLVGGGLFGIAIVIVALVVITLIFKYKKKKSLTVVVPISEDSSSPFQLSSLSVNRTDAYRLLFDATTSLISKEGTKKDDVPPESVLDRATSRSSVAKSVSPASSFTRSLPSHYANLHSKSPDT